MTSPKSRTPRQVRVAFLAFATFAAMFWSTQTLAETRVALIIGNSAYQKADMRLANPANDAKAMAEKLQSAGFITIVKYNAKRADFYHALNEFRDKIARDPHAVGLFYYAGHAVQADGINYLIPVDAEIEAQSDLEPNAFDAAKVLKSMTDAQNDMNIVILDACRNNPLPKTRGMDRGLARIDAPNGTFIAFSAGPGQTAQDGTAGSNGVFTAEFLKAMSEPGLPLEQVFKKVVIGVRAATKGAQTPWQESSMQSDFSFYPKSGSVAAANAGTPSTAAAFRHVDNASEVEQSFWDRIKDSTDPADFKDYKTQYPNGPHAAEAALLMRKLNRSVASDTATTAQKMPQAGASDTRSMANDTPDSTLHLSQAAAALRGRVTPPPPSAKSLVESRVAGVWTMKIPSPQGISTCYWNVKEEGTYLAWCIGAAPVAHAGTVSVADGRWTLNATTMNYTDGGTYVFSNPDTMVMTGKLGTAAWLRTK